jgi:hypothetical protein
MIAEFERDQEKEDLETQAALRAARTMPNDPTEKATSQLPQ